MALPSRPLRIIRTSLVEQSEVPSGCQSCITARTRLSSILDTKVGGTIEPPILGTVFPPQLSFRAIFPPPATLFQNSQSMIQPPRRPSLALFIASNSLET